MHVQTHMFLNSKSTLLKCGATEECWELVGLLIPQIFWCTYYRKLVWRKQPEKQKYVLGWPHNEKHIRPLWYSAENNRRKTARQMRKRETKMNMGRRSKRLAWLEMIRPDKDSSWKVRLIWDIFNLQQWMINSYYIFGGNCEHNICYHITKNKSHFMFA